jgi:hypothetical protein
MKQDRRIITMFRLNGIHEIYHLGLTAQGNPRHAAYVEKGAKPILWKEIN